VLSNNTLEVKELGGPCWLDVKPATTMATAKIKRLFQEITHRELIHSLSLSLSLSLSIYIYIYIYIYNISDRQDPPTPPVSPLLVCSRIFDACIHHYRYSNI
jgi:hypothetical protein